jgi:hypothetical protein
MRFKTWLENEEQQDRLHAVVQKVFGNIQPENDVYWIPFLDKTIYAQLRGPDNASNIPYVIVAFFNTDDLGADLSTVSKSVQPSTMPLMRKLQEFGGELSKAGLRMVYTPEKRKTVDGVEKEPTNQRAAIYDRLFGKAGMRKVGVVQDDDEYHVWENMKCLS